MVCVGDPNSVIFETELSRILIPFRRCEISSATHTHSVRLECNFDPWPGELKKDTSPKVLLTSGYTARALTGTHRFGSIFWSRQTILLRVARGEPSNRKAVEKLPYQDVL